MADQYPCQQIILFDDQKRGKFLPLVYTKPVGLLRMGMWTMAERWQRVTQCDIFFETQAYLQELFPPLDLAVPKINARLVPTSAVLAAFAQLKPGEKLVFQNESLMVWPDVKGQTIERKWSGEQPIMLEQITDLFTKNDAILRLDFDLSDKNGQGEIQHTTVIGPDDQLFIHPLAKVLGATINVSTGPVYIDADAEVMEGATIRGPFYLGQHAQVKMGAKIYGATTIGPECKCGGEISNSVFQGFSNKGHDGFIGNALIGEWCNLGADTNSSNLKNNYSAVSIYQYDVEDYVDTGLTFCGLIMGDHSKCGINTMFNTGTVVGLGANIFGGDFPEKHIPSFSWGGSAGWQEYDLQKMLQTAERVFARRNWTLSPEMRKMLTEVFDLTSKQRSNAPQSQ
jgi:UDP-N-acetylglucosamine diphosphorylase/glucosamine-1-phosphate N-acetyltransferase